MDINNIGFDSWFQEKLDPDTPKEFVPARVTTVNKDSFIVNTGSKEIPAEPTGKFLFDVDSALDYPAVGDWIYVQLYDGETLAIVQDLFPRKSLLKRKAPGKKVDYQLIAANIDTALIVQSLDHNFNLRRLERYLVMVREGNIEPVVLLSKSDLIGKAELETKAREINDIMPDIDIISFSNEDGSGVEELKAFFKPAKTYCLLGSSGVGKTTLLNNLLENEEFITLPVREKDSRGRHATTRRQLIRLPGGAMIIDTPGMRELGNFGIESGLSQTFDEISELAANCRFNDCTHTRESGCAVLLALESGTLLQERYDSFIKLGKESAYHQRTYLEQKERDKKFGKMVKSIMKHKKNKR